MARSYRHLGEFETLILFAILRLEDAAYGVRIRQDIEARTGRDLSHGAIYTTLERLETRGLVEPLHELDAKVRAGRPRRHYALTPLGAQLLQRSYGALSKMAHGLSRQLDILAAEATPGGSTSQ